MKKDNKKKIFLVPCILFLVILITGTYAYFVAKSTDENSLSGQTAVVSFGLSVQKMTDADVVKSGLIPMNDDYSPFAAKKLCYDDSGYAVCQIYKISLTNTGNTDLYLDGYLNLALVNDDEMRFLRVYYDGDNYCTSEDCSVAVENCDNDLDLCENNLLQFVNDNVKTGIEFDDGSFSRDEDFDSLLVMDEYLGKNASRDLYVMIWIHNLEEEQDDLQGVENVFHGKVTFLSSEGNEVTAVFDN